MITNSYGHSKRVITLTILKTTRAIIHPPITTVSVSFDLLQHVTDLISDT